MIMKLVKKKNLKASDYFPKLSFTNSFTRLKSILGHLNPDEINNSDNDFFKCKI